MARPSARLPAIYVIGLLLLQLEPKVKAFNASLLLLLRTRSGGAIANKGNAASTANGPNTYHQNDAKYHSKFTRASD